MTENTIVAIVVVAAIITPAIVSGLHANKDSHFVDEKNSLVKWAAYYTECEPSGEISDGFMKWDCAGGTQLYKVRHLELEAQYGK